MKKYLLITLLCAVGADVCAKEADGLVNYPSNHSVDETFSRIEKILEKKGFNIFASINHSENASRVGIEMKGSRLLIFGNPKIGSQLMKCNPTIAIDLPQKALVWQDSNDKVWLSVNSPEYLKNRHALSGCDKFIVKIKSVLKKISTEATH